MARHRTEIPDIPETALSAQQKSIYRLAAANLNNKEIGDKLGIDPRNVAVQLSRIRKKMKNLGYTYKLEPRAEPDQNREVSPAQALKNRIHNDPGYIILLYQRYGTGSDISKQDRSMLAAVEKDSALSRGRLKRLKLMSCAGKKGEGSVLMKLSRENRDRLKRFSALKGNAIIESYWDDGSAIYKVTRREFEQVRDCLGIRT
ncbi:MAG: hypothetical protein JL50_20985 [Peptococcaceae bacterium BICA1-7]|nr:MAG: hypothetical protein JL50_20985 [Peptococcaceae bacterium BICA1-7]HBV98559.1 hypothetical protein [Desulfotomaculum sp.]